MSNFAFLKDYDLLLCTLAEQAERLCDVDPNAAVGKLRQFEELLARVTASDEAVDISMCSTMVEVLEELRKRRVLPPHVANAFHRLRIEGNKALHPDPNEPLHTANEARQLLQSAHGLAVWFSERRAQTRSGANPTILRPVALPTREPILAAPRAESATTGQSPVGIGQEAPSPGVSAGTALQRIGAVTSRALVVTRNQPEGAILTIGERVAADLEALGEDAAPIREMIAAGAKRVEAAKAAFRLGVVGEFRAGKSSLINALLGADLALVGVKETTGWIARYGQGLPEQARLFFSGDRQETRTHADTNSLLDRNKEDEAWLAQLDRVEFAVASPRPLNFELWDAPGLGGRDENEALANRFIDTVGGALWVFDSGLLGSSSLVWPLRKLRAAGKRVIGVINRVDELSPDEVEQAVEFVQAEFGQDLDAVVPISAKVMRGESDAGRQMRAALLDQIQHVIIDTAQADRQLRIDRAIGQAALGLSDGIRSAECALHDRIGLVLHTRENFERACTRTLAEIPKYVEDVVRNAFSGEDAEARKALSVIFRDGEPDRRQVARLVENLDRACTLTGVWPVAVKHVLQCVESEWMRNGHDAIRLTQATVKDGTVSSPDLERVQVRLRAGRSEEVEEKAANTALVVTTSTATAFAVLAAASTTIAWPIILAALPLGLAAGYFHTQVATATGPEFSIDDALGLITEVVAMKRSHLSNRLVAELPNAIETVLRAEMERLLAAFEKAQLSGRDLANFQSMANDIMAGRRKLRVIAREHLGDAAVPAEWDRESESIIVPAGSAGIPILSQMIGRSARRVDIATGSWEADLRPLLVHVRAGASVRWLTTCRRDEFDTVSSEIRRKLSNWRGDLTSRVVWREDGRALTMGEVSVLVDDGAWTTDDSITRQETKPMTWKVHPRGKLAAARVFAELWIGSSLELGTLHVTTV